MKNFQLSLFYNLQAFIETSNFHRKYYYLFSALDLSGVPDKNYGVGRTGYSRRAMLRAFIVKHLERISRVPQLVERLDAQPVLAEMCGFEMGAIPDASQFYRFLTDTPHRLLEDIHHELNHKLVEEGVLSLEQFAMDSKPVLAATRENNPKNPGRNTRDKNKKPRRNPKAALSYYSHQTLPDGSKRASFFWGYRTHVIVSKEGVALLETTLPANLTDAEVAKKLVKKLKRLYKFKKSAIFIGDAAYDVKELYDLIVDKLKCEAFIPLNPRNTRDDKTFGPHGAPLCDAGIEMAFAGEWREGRRDRVKFRCPLKTSRETSDKFPDGCPAAHPHFSEGAAYGCTKYLDVTDDARKRVARNSPRFKVIYKQRIVVEQYFARLGEREAEQTTHYNLRAIKNQMTIAHLSLSLVAVATAILMKRIDKIRCYHTFAHREKPPLTG